MSEVSPLFEPLEVGPVTLSHRISMAPMTRLRADDQHVPLPFVADYYAQRGSVPGTLLITEGTLIDARAGGLANVPGIYNSEQIEAWKKVTAAVHAKGSYIFCQVAAFGRAADPANCAEEGIERLSSSKVPMSVDQPAAELMTKEHIESFIAMFAQAARNAIEAGFDGVELHGAYGYLIDQFTQDTCNDRVDEYGGSIENRARFCIEAAQAVAAAIGADRTGVRLSPYSTYQGMRMADPVPQFRYLIERLRENNLGYVHLVESYDIGNQDTASIENLDWAIKAWGPNRSILLAGGFNPDSAKLLVEKEYPGYKIVVVFARYFLCNPDLPFRIKQGLQLEQYDPSQFYKPKSPEGYIDFPFSPQFVNSARV